MTDSSHFTIERHERCLFVSLKGQWDLSADMRYLTELTRYIAQIQTRPWGVVVDMLEWSLPISEQRIDRQDVANIHLDRRNQIFECWIVKDEFQALELQHFVETISHVQFNRVDNMRAAKQWITTFNL